MNDTIEQRAVELAIERGLVSARDVARVDERLACSAPEPAAGGWGRRLSALVHEGRLQPAAVEALIGELAPDRTTLVDSNGQRANGPDGAIAGPGLATVERDVSNRGEIDDEAPPVEGWDRYDIVRFIGRGGMARVYQAHDPRLGRTVALKFLRRDDPEQARRLVREARAQARVEHEHVCRVYEVGEVGGHPFIAMQYIQGQPVSALAASLGLEQKVELMRRVAEGLHAAHRIGLIHRDIKPGNILVEHREDGGLHPYVVDFGLARQSGAPGLTATGMLAGTPAYMSPEQVSGDASLLDRRSDVYSLGVTLYRLLAGQTPFSGQTAFDVMQQHVSKDPPRLREYVAGVPRDLEAVVMQCLEKEPHRRYDSARALAENLQRFLDGEPVAARLEGPAGRLRRWVRRNRRLVAVVVVSVAVAATLSGLWIRSWWFASRQSALAHRLGIEVRDIEAQLRFMRMALPHDIRNDRAAIRRRLEDLRVQVEELGPPAQGPGHAALGRAYLALHEVDSARDHLQEAWDAGYREPEVRVHLGLALGWAYHRALGEARQMPDRALRAARTGEIERALRDPALALLGDAGTATVTAPAYVEGLIALWEGRHDTARTRAREAFARSPWLFEAKQLEGDAALGEAFDLYTRGEYQRASVLLEEAGQAFQVALQLGHSDPATRLSDCRRQRTTLQVQLASGGPARAAYEDAVDVCDQALLVDPGNARALTEVSTVQWLWAEAEIERGRDPSEVLERCREAATAAVRLDHGLVRAHNNIGNARLLEARRMLQRGADPRPLLELAAAAYGEALVIQPEAALSHNNLGLVSSLRRDYESSQGADPRASIDEAIASFRRAVTSQPAWARAHVNLALAYHSRAEENRLRGEDPRPALDSAGESARRAIELNPGDHRAHLSLGRILEARAATQADLGIDAGETLASAIASYWRAVEINPGSAHARGSLAGSLLGRGEYSLSRGVDPTDDLERAEFAYVNALELNPRSRSSHINLGNVYALRAEHELRSGRDPQVWLERAADHFRSAVELDPGSALARVNLANTDVTRARFESLRGGDPRPYLDRALSVYPQPSVAGGDVVAPATSVALAWCMRAELEVAQGSDPSEALGEARRALNDAAAAGAKSAELHQRYGQVALVEAGWATRSGASPEHALEQAEEHLVEAFGLKPADATIVLDLADVHHHRAEWQLSNGKDPTADVDTGLEWCVRGAALDPSMGELLATRGALYLLRARAAGRAGDPGDDAARAVQLLEQALEHNPLLRGAYGSQLAEARQLAGEHSQLSEPL